MKGYIALSMVIIITAVVIAVATTVALLAVGEAESALTQENGENTWSFVDGCAEDALLKIHDNSSFVTSTFTRPEGTCSVTVVAGNPNWDIKVTSSALIYNNTQRTIEVKATKGTTITITSWQEI